MDISRKTAYLTLLDMEEKESYSNLALNRRLKEAPSAKSAFVRELVYGVQKRKITLDYMLDRFLSRPVVKMKAGERTLLRMGMYQLQYMDGVPAYAAVGETVALARIFCKSKAGLINAVLRNCQREPEKLALPPEKEGLIKHLSVKHSCGEALLTLWLDQYGRERTESLLTAGNETPELVIRPNLLKTNADDLAKKLETEGFSVRKSSLLSTALLVEGSGLLDTDYYKNGEFSVQDESSQLAAAALDPLPGQLVMDLCAAPGGKSLALAERMENKGKLLAGDLYPHKLELLEKEAARLGITIIETEARDASLPDPAMAGKADRVLADVPCSGLGVIRRKPEIKYRQLGEEWEQLPEKQLAILEAASGYVAEDGILLYSTCTLCRGENQSVTAAFLEKHSEFKTEEERELAPDKEGCDGFYFCRFRRVRDCK